MEENESSYPSNSNRSKEKVKKVGHGVAVIRRKSIKERIKDLIFEPVDSDGYDYVYEDIIRPAFLDMLGDISHNIVDSIRETIDVALFGGSRGRRSSRYYRSSYDDYDEYWNRERRSRRRDRDIDDDRRRSRRSDDVAAKFETRSEAVSIIKAMQERVHDYQVASVLNFYDMADMPTRSTDDNYGWDLGHPFEASIERVRDGYIVQPCAPIWLDR